MSAVWWSQPFAPEGSTASDGILRQLGAPELDPLVVMLRESAQNSWDARLTETGNVSVRYTVERLGDRAEPFRDVLLPGPVGDLADLDRHLGPGSVVLGVSDRGTSGLGGPLRSNVPAGAEPPNFVNFVRNVGEARDRDGGGGTYGFGKGALFRLSRPGVLLVDTLCTHAGRPQRRLMGAALGSTFVHDGVRHTGRHWWGSTDDGVVDPLLDDAADEVATRLGLRGFADGRTGTDVYILGADLGVEDEDDDAAERGVRSAATTIASAALWYLWPRLLRDRAGQGRIDVEVVADGTPVQVPDPEATTRLRCFTDALRKLDDGEGVPHRRTRRAPFDVGAFAASKDTWVPRVDAVIDTAAPFDGPSHHCARMRHVELVVDYVVGEPLDDPGLHYGAVFRVSSEPAAEACFAAAEPPTHDAWVVQHLVGTQRNVVANARRFVGDQMTAFAGRRAVDAGEPTAVPLGGLSSVLATMLPSTGDGAGGSPDPDGGGSGGGGGSGSTGVRAHGQPYLIMRDGEALVAQRVRFATSNVAVGATARADVAVDGGTEKVPPTGAPVPEVVGWQDGDGPLVPGADVVVAPHAGREWIVFVRPAPDTATTVRVAEVRP